MILSSFSYCLINCNAIKKREYFSVYEEFQLIYLVIIVQLVKRKRGKPVDE